MSSVLGDSSSDEEVVLEIAASSDDENDIFNERIHRMRRPRRGPRYFFDIDVSPREFREKHRVSPELLDHLAEWLGPELSRPNNRGLPLSPKQRIQIFLHFLGTNGYHHDIGGCHVISRRTVGTIVREVCNVMFSHRNEVIKWPSHPEKIAGDFFKIAKIPCVAGVIDGTHIPVHPPANDEVSYINRKQGHSINCLAVAGTGTKTLI